MQHAGSSASRGGHILVLPEIRTTTQPPPPSLFSSSLLTSMSSSSSSSPAVPKSKRQKKEITPRLHYHPATLDASGQLAQTSRHSCTNLSHIEELFVESGAHELFYQKYAAELQAKNLHSRIFAFALNKASQRRATGRQVDPLNLKDLVKGQLIKYMTDDMAKEFSAMARKFVTDAFVAKDKGATQPSA